MDSRARRDRREDEMLTLRACPRCGGDLHANRDMYGSYTQCLQCGYMKDLDDPSRLSKLLEYAANKKKVA